MARNKKKQEQLPEFFKPLLWSYDMEAVDPVKHKRAIIVNTINYGDLKHWRWLVDFYGGKNMQDFLSELPQTELRKRVQPLVKRLFSLRDFSHAQRSTH